MPVGVHVVPVNDDISHTYDDCLCGPTAQWVNPDTGETYDDGPLVIHHSLDGREHAERPQWWR